MGLWNLDRLPAQGTIVTCCQSGLRSSVVASALRNAGCDVVELEGSYAAWSPPQQNAAPATTGWSMWLLEVGSSMGDDPTSGSFNVGPPYSAQRTPLGEYSAGPCPCALNMPSR